MINIQASTLGHKDKRDNTLCVTIPFGDYIGGELVLHEAGIVIGRGPGDIIIFPSCHFTHFSLDFIGTRCGLILFSDVHGDDWVRYRNGWKDHMVVNEEANNDHDRDHDSDAMSTS